MRFLFRNQSIQRRGKLSHIENYEVKHWSWLKENPTSVATLNRLLWRGSFPSGSFYLMLSLSSAISTFGLIDNNAAAIIGAMIIVPLIRPTVGIAYAMVMANRRLLRQSGLTAITGIMAAVVIAFLIASLIGSRTLNPEIMSRTSPTLIDLGIALGAGIAAAFAYTRQSVADTLPGTAVALALVPPLGVIGIGLATWHIALIKGASILFLTNFVGIIFSGSLVFLFQGYGTIARAQQGLVVTILALLLLGVPLGYQLRNFLAASNVRTNIEKLIRDRQVVFANKEIRSVEVASQSNSLLVKLEIETQRNSISTQQLKAAQAFLSKELEKPVTLRVKVIPIESFKIPAGSGSKRRAK